VVSLAGLSTGKRSGEHGLAGYNLRNPETLQVQNLLSGWESIPPSQLGKDLSTWKAFETVSELLSNVKLHVVSKEIYRSSGFTRLTMPNAIFSAADDFDARVRRALELGRQPGNLVYLYFPELDQAGHRFGSQSQEWSDVLESIDAALSPLLASKVATLVTADHGMIDVPITGHCYLEELVSLKGRDFASGGDTRVAYLYLDEATGVADSLALELADAAWVTNWGELAEAGWVKAPKQVDARYPDVVIVARKSVVFYDRRVANPRALQMIGHHGAISDQETMLPFLLNNLKLL
jgi:predicted AlkP superfamily pyrophosphatase or phosphodiesterase